MTARMPAIIAFLFALIEGAFGGDFLPWIIIGLVFVAIAEVRDLRKALDELKYVQIETLKGVDQLTGDEHESV